MAKKLMMRRGRTLKVKRTEMAVEAPEEPKEAASNREIFRAKAAEWKQMKSQVARLKENRKKLGKKNADEKKIISKQIKQLLSETRAREEEMDVSE